MSETRKTISWRTWLSALVLVVTLVAMIRSDLSYQAWAVALSGQGSPAPAGTPDSATGYALGQRNFLGTHERGETYRWISYAQDLIATGPFTSAAYRADNAPSGRPRLAPRIYAGWVAAISWGVHFVSGAPIGISVERAALWEPVISHGLAFVALVAFFGFQFGATGAAFAGLFFALFPPFSAQFLPGVLTPRTWALFLSAYVIAHAILAGREGRADSIFSLRATVAAALALWLDPAFGFPAVLIVAAAAGCRMVFPGTRLPCLRWALIGSGLALAAWLTNRSPWSPAVGELRYIHPLYAAAWLGIGLGLDAWQNRRLSGRRRRWLWLEATAALLLVAMLPCVQLEHGYWGWLYPGATVLRLTSLDETTVFRHATDWLTDASTAEIAGVSTPVLIALLIVAVTVWPRRGQHRVRWHVALAPIMVFAGVLVFAFFRTRWIVIASLVALPVAWSLLSAATAVLQRTALVVGGAFLVGLFAWGRSLPPSLQITSAGALPGAADIQALVYRHFSHWIADHNAGQNVCALAPPELSDSLVFHGGCRVLMSTAWESYPGEVAASRILSAPEATEAEAVLRSLGVTHVILPSWDKVLPLLVREPKEPGRDTLYARLQHWVLPLYLRPIPYPLPRVPGYLDQKLPVFKVTPPQDDALALSRLAEYFVEMNRDEPATLAAKVLAESFPDDPNAAIARAIVAAHVRDQPEFDRALGRLAADASAGRSPFSWDRRVQRAIVFALGRRSDLERSEIRACVAQSSPELLFDLTPLQAYRLGVLAREDGVSFPNPRLANLVAALGAEYLPAGRPPPTH